MLKLKPKKISFLVRARRSKCADFNQQGFIAAAASREIMRPA